ncbi:MAG: hypothetical protein IIT64_01650 [Bacteroidaceae bacterium]|nr:hypothetical protein [Bacteroidaceae bacterium]
MANDNGTGIPLGIIVEYAKAQPTQAKRQAFVNLIRFWADNGGDLAEAIKAILEIQGGQVISANSMPKEFMPYYRSETIAVKLIDIIRKIDEKIASKEDNWDWAHVMRVMIDEGIILTNTTPNKFDQLICAMVPGKGRDNVRKNGDYSILDNKDPWPLWTKESHLNPQEAQDRTICNMIAKEFEPVLRRKIIMNY